MSTRFCGCRATDAIAHWLAAMLRAWRVGIAHWLAALLRASRVGLGVSEIGPRPRAAVWRGETGRVKGINAVWAGEGLGESGTRL